MNTNLDYLRQATRRYDGLMMNDPENPEVLRFKDVIIPDIRSKLTEEELLTLDVAPKKKTDKEIAEERAAEIAAMQFNVDKPSI